MEDFSMGSYIFILTSIYLLRLIYIFTTIVCIIHVYNKVLSSSLGMSNPYFFAVVIITLGAVILYFTLKNGTINLLGLIFHLTIPPTILSRYQICKYSLTWRSISLTEKRASLILIGDMEMDQYLLSHIIIVVDELFFKVYIENT